MASNGMGTNPMDSNAIRLWRKAERQRLIQARGEAAEADRAAWSAAIAPLLYTVTEEVSPGIIGFYWPFKGEFDPLPYIREQFALGRRAALPVITQKNHPMEFHLWTPDAEMEAGHWGIPIPKARQMVTPDLILAPLVGFDAGLFRLGYGGGYFDRTLAALHPRPFALGVGFELGFMPTVHPQEYDIPMNAIVTETGIRRL